MSADLMDPWDLPAETHQPPLSPEEVQDIGDVIRDHQFDDRVLIPDLYAIGFEALCRLGVAGDREASRAVRLMLQRALLGGPLPSIPRGPIA